MKEKEREERKKGMAEKEGPQSYKEEKGEESRGERRGEERPLCYCSRLTYCRRVGPLPS